MKVLKCYSTTTSLCLLSLLLLTQCQTSKHPSQAAFVQYLQSAFGQEISTEVRYYILLPSNQCHNCFSYMHDVNEKFADSTVLITSMNPKLLNGFEHVLFDTTNLLDRQNFTKHSNTIITMEGGEITDLETNVSVEVLFQ